jgi:hypothetical protein
VRSVEQLPDLADRAIAMPAAGCAPAALAAIKALEVQAEPLSPRRWALAQASASAVTRAIGSVQARPRSSAESQSRRPGAARQRPIKPPRAC